MFPQALEGHFKSLGVDIHDPAFGAWWDSELHQAASPEYNRRWREWFRSNRNPSLDDMTDFGKELADEYGFLWFM